ncbi:hypothetical protein GDO81_013091 [Engystomops pustulosus]|uniref:Uncharacterized protein n=1 Tax=Engystomops pustulosus TaxID=76066 RepID=A0AAV7AXZ0_ENGPU|nr:hypothetical protein GDO81_013091 [Engystomops pustulosus]
MCYIKHLERLVLSTPFFIALKLVSNIGWYYFSKFPFNLLPANSAAYPFYSTANLVVILALEIHLMLLRSRCFSAKVFSSDIL